ncbi:hypothetical protein [Polymorphospora rubra]|uniref:Uncharacterized protein n=1 Tax=Polymorphospora rubra TaxID=338584 RepID=A0A810MSF7_9ACTN|nr:hypothetical protein [Polymorphospora rubra]BCJ64166.1 hypothetical protein Prubr_11870 [Polymorphospora rubra]
MSLTILGTLLAAGIAWRVWRQGGLITALLALALGAIVAAAGGPFAGMIRAVVNVTQAAITWLSGLLF